MHTVYRLCLLGSKLLNGNVCSSSSTSKWPVIPVYTGSCCEYHSPFSFCLNDKAFGILDNQMYCVQAGSRWTR